MAPAVLLVDDDPEELELLEAALAPLGLETQRALDGEEAAHLAERREFAAAIVDLVMPRLNGFETAALIRGSARGRSLPILILSGYDRDGARRLPGFADAAGVEYLSKPFSTEALRRRVAAHAERFRERRPAGS